MQRIKLFIISLTVMLGVAPMMAPMYLKAQTANNINCGITGNLSEDCKDAPSDDGTVTNTIQGAIRLFQVVVGLIAVFMVIFGGLKYITSGGNDAGVKAAKNTLLYAVIGLVIVLIAEGIVRFVLTRFSS